MIRRIRFGVLVLAFLAPACTSPRAVPPDPSRVRTLIVHSSRDLPADLASMLEQVDGVQWARSATTGMVDLTAVSATAAPMPPRVSGGVLPFTVAALEPSPVAGDEVSAALQQGEALLNPASAAVRGLRAGDTITLASGSRKTTLRIAGVSRDERASESEAVIPLAAARTLGLANVRQVIVSVTERAARTVAEVARDLSYPTPVRTGSVLDIRTPEAGRILSLGEIKRAFGEFTFAPRSGSRFLTPHPAWIAANIVETDVPLMGRIKCNRKILGPLNSAMRQLQAEGLAGLVAEPAGCYSPRMQFGNVKSLSRHTFGIAVDINPTANPFGAASTQDQRLVEVMRRWGFAWGGVWLVPDAMHFEYAPEELFTAR